jgi:hypothetical protein
MSCVGRVWQRRQGAAQLLGAVRNAWPGRRRLGLLRLRRGRSGSGMAAIPPPHSPTHPPDSGIYRAEVNNRPDCLAPLTDGR